MLPHSLHDDHGRTPPAGPAAALSLERASSRRLRVRLGEIAGRRDEFLLSYRDAARVSSSPAGCSRSQHACLRPTLEDHVLVRCPPRRGQSRHRSSQASHTCSGAFGGPPASYSPVHEVFKLSCRLTAIFGWMPREERHPVELSQPASQPVWWSRVRVPLSRPTIFHFYRLHSDGHGFNSNNVQAMAHIFFANVGACSRHLHLRQLSVIFGRRRSAAPTFPRCQEDAVGRARPSTLVAASDMPSKITNAAGTDTLDAKRTPSVCACPSTLVAASDMPSEGHQRRQYQHPRCQEDAVGLCMPIYARRCQRHAKQGHQRRQYRHPRCQEDAVGPCTPVHIDDARPSHQRPCSAHTDDVPLVTTLIAVTTYAR